MMDQDEIELRMRCLELAQRMAPNATMEHIFSVSHTLEAYARGQINNRPRKNHRRAVPEQWQALRPNPQPDGAGA